MNVDHLTLKMFVALAETCSFTKASERVFRTQSAVSQRIAQLENDLGKPLIQRIKKNKELAITNEGEVFLKFAREMLKLDREMLAYFKAPELAGEVKFGLPEDFVAVFIDKILPEFVAMHPLVSVNIECDLTLNLFEHFKKGEFDLVLVKMKQPEELSAHSVNIWSEHLEWVCAKNTKDVFAFDKTIPLVLSPMPCVYRSTATKILEDHDFRWRMAFTSPSYAGKIAAVKAGLGITVFPKNMIPADLVILNDSILPILPNTHVSLLKKQDENPAVLSFEKFVFERLVGKSLVY
jgi:DNA-binding transcriptional LysR family regulator